MNEEQLRAQYEAEHGQKMTDANFRAFLRLMELFGVTDARSYRDARDRIMERMESRVEQRARAAFAFARMTGGCIN